ncbi:hypothetical protein P3T43_001791 [Paraburkholderia sp. GAS41]|uniref:hypothetical protein n=1 Tax=Paraburkholderia sp. GAS41 TaxID=3035134 RepID=UPI003D22B647
MDTQKINCRSREDGAVEFASVADFEAAISLLAEDSTLPKAELAERVAALTAKMLTGK